MRKSMEKSRDRIGELPDGILDSILSLLPMKYAISTSILSRRWRNLWKSSWSYATLLDFGKEFAKAQTQGQFVTTVNQYLQLHTSNKFEKFRLFFHPGDQYKVDLEKWIAFAVLSGVKELDLILCPETDMYSSIDNRFILPHILFGCDSLIRLSSSHIEFNPPSGFSGFRSLVTLRLNQVNITDEALLNVLSNSPVLCNLCLRLCSMLRSIKISGPDLQLQCLSLLVTNAYEVDIFAPKLKSFHFYGDILYGYSFRNVAALEDVFISADGYEFSEPEHDFIQILSGVSHVKALTMCIGTPMFITTAEEYNPEALPIALANLQELQILIGGEIGEEYLGHIFCFFKHTICPLLEKLFIDLSGPCLPLILHYTKQAEEPSSCVFDNLRIVKINHFKGSDTEMKMIKFFLDRAVILESVILIAAPTAHTDNAINNAKEGEDILDQLLSLPMASENVHIRMLEHSLGDASDIIQPIHKRSEFYLGEPEICCNED